MVRQQGQLGSVVSMAPAQPDTAPGELNAATAGPSPRELFTARHPDAPAWAVELYEQNDRVERLINETAAAVVAFGTEAEAMLSGGMLGKLLGGPKQKPSSQPSPPRAAPG